MLDVLKIYKADFEPVLSKKSGGCMHGWVLKQYLRIAYSNQNGEREIYR